MTRIFSVFIMRLLVLRRLERLDMGAEIESSRSESDGTIPFSDHAFDRLRVVFNFWA